MKLLDEPLATLLEVSPLAPLYQSYVCDELEVATRGTTVRVTVCPLTMVRLTGWVEIEGAPQLALTVIVAVTLSTCPQLSLTRTQYAVVADIGGVVKLLDGPLATRIDVSPLFPLYHS